MDEELKRYLDEKFERITDVFAAEIGSLHTQIAKANYPGGAGSQADALA